MGYTSVYPPAHNDTYVKATSRASNFYYPYYATNPALSITGAAINNAYLTLSGTLSKFNIDLGSAQYIPRVYIENYHSSGGYTNVGAKTIEVYGAADDAGGAAAFANLVYTDLTNLTLVGTLTVAEHIAVDSADPQYFALTATTPYRYFICRLVEGYNAEPTLSGFRRIELQEDDGHGEGALTLGEVSLSAVGGGAGSVEFQPVEISGVGGGAGSIALQPVEIFGIGGGVGALSLDNLTISGAGQTTVPMVMGGEIGYILDGGFYLNSRKPVEISGTIPYILTGGFDIDRFVIEGTIPYILTGGFDISVDVQLDIGGSIPYTLVGGFDIASIPLSLTGHIPYTLTGGFDIDRGQWIEIAGDIPYTLTGGFSLYDEADLELGGNIPYVLTGGFTIDSGASCGGVMQFSEDTIC